MALEQKIATVLKRLEKAIETPPAHMIEIEKACAISKLTKQEVIDNLDLLENGKERWDLYTAMITVLNRAVLNERLLEKKPELLLSNTADFPALQIVFEPFEYIDIGTEVQEIAKERAKVVLNEN